MVFVLSYIAFKGLLWHHRRCDAEGFPPARGIITRVKESSLTANNSENKIPVGIICKRRWQISLILQLENRKCKYSFNLRVILTAERLLASHKGWKCEGKRAFINGGPFDGKFIGNILFGKPSRRWEDENYMDLPASYATSPVTMFRRTSHSKMK
jgi:hypothetical protein